MTNYIIVQSITTDDRNSHHEMVIFAIRATFRRLSIFIRQTCLIDTNRVLCALMVISAREFWT